MLYLRKFKIKFLLLIYKITKLIDYNTKILIQNNKIIKPLVCGIESLLERN